MSVAGIGHNSGASSLAEMLIEETEDLKRRADDLIAAAGRAVVTDDETAEKATLLLGMMKSHAGKIEAARKERKQPFIDGGNTVQQHFVALGMPLVGSDLTKLTGGAAKTVLDKLDARRRQKEAEAAAERRRQEEEARRLREETAKAEHARLAAEAEQRRQQEEAARLIREAEENARRAGDKAAAEQAARERAENNAKIEREQAASREAALQAEIDRRRNDEAIAEAERRANAAAPVAIDSGYGIKASGRKVVTAIIVDIKKAAATALKFGEPAMRETIQKILDRQARAGNTNLPGAEIHEDSQTVIRGAA